MCDKSAVLFPSSDFNHQSKPENKPASANAFPSILVKFIPDSLDEERQTACRGGKYGQGKPEQTICLIVSLAS